MFWGIPRCGLCLVVTRKFLEFTGSNGDGRCSKCKSHQFLVQDGPDSMGHTFLHSYINTQLGNLSMNNIIHHWSGSLYWPCRAYYKEIL